MAKQLFQVWREGYVCTGNRDDARCLGEAEADSFEEACQIVLGDEETFNPERLTLWACRLFPSETLAREGFMITRRQR